MKISRRSAAIIPLEPTSTPIGLVTKSNVVCSAQTCTCGNDVEYIIGLPYRSRYFLMRGEVMMMAMILPVSTRSDIRDEGRLTSAHTPNLAICVEDRVHTTLESEFE